MTQNMVLDDRAWSHKAWMSQIDADLFERVILNVSRRAAPRLDILEWGTGKSTFYFSRLLNERGLEYSWLSLEYDRAYFLDAVQPQLSTLENAQVKFAEQSASPAQTELDSATARIKFVVFDYGKLQPFLLEHAADRFANLDAYVNFPASLARKFDLIFVDGRKRRRCLLQAARLMKPNGVTLLHDAYRRHYQCAFDAFVSQRMLGEILWIGSQRETDFLDIIL